MPPKHSAERKRGDSTADGEPALKPTAIVFRSPGLQADTRLKVFDQEFHVHSVLLKLHSAYFRKFLDSADKNADSSSASLFKYDYVRVVDEDGTWGLETVATAPPSTASAISKVGRVDLETSMFRNLLCSIYHRPYIIENILEFNTLFQIADFYCALPILSAGLTNMMLKSRLFTVSGAGKFVSNTHLSKEAFELIVMAKKLRHAALFKECFVHVVGQWDPQLHKIDDPEILILVVSEYARLCETIIDTLQVLHQLNNLQPTIFIGQIEGALASGLMARDPCLYRMLFVKLEELKNNNAGGGDWDPFFEELEDELEKLLKNNLTLDRKDYIIGTDVRPYMTFLCADIPEEQMPWNKNEIDW